MEHSAALAEIPASGAATRLASRAWLMVWMCMLGTMCCSTSVVLINVGVFMKPLAETFGWTRGAIALSLSIGAISMAAANPFVGRLNNDRVRTALHGALDSFLTTMVVDEALTGYQLEVTATRADEIAGRCIVNVAMQPTFSIDYIRVTLALS